MGGRVVMIDGYESGGTDFIEGSIVTPNAVETSPVYEGTYAMKIIGSAAGGSVTYNLDTSLAVDLDHIFGFAFRYNQAPAVEVAILRSGSTLALNLRQNTSGEIFLESITGSSSTYALSVDTWYYIEIFWAHRDSGTSYIYVDGVQRVSFTSDFSAGASQNAPQLSNQDVAFTTDPANTVWFDNFYVKENCVLADLIADSSGSAPFVKIAGVYNNTAEDATDQGTTLDAGTWGDMSDVPAADDAADAGYTGGVSSGHQISDEGSRSGPSGDGITGTILGAAWASIMKRTGGGGTEHYAVYGHNGDVVTSADLVLANNTWNNYVFVGDVVVQSDSHVPTTSESSAIGMAKNGGARDGYCQDHYCQLLIEPDVAPAARRVFITHI